MLRESETRKGLLEVAYLLSGTNEEHFGLNFSLGEGAVDKVTSTLLLDVAYMAHRFKIRSTRLEK